MVGVVDDRPVFLKDIANVSDGPDEVTNYVRHGWGAASSFEKHESTPGWVISSSRTEHYDTHGSGDEAINESKPAVTIAVSKQKGANAVQVSEAVIREANRLRTEILPDDVQLIVTRNNGIVANEKVNELIEALSFLSPLDVATAQDPFSSRTFFGVHGLLNRGGHEFVRFSNGSAQNVAV